MTFLRGVRGSQLVGAHIPTDGERFAWLVTLSLRTLVTKLKIHASDGKSPAEALKLLRETMC